MNRLNILPDNPEQEKKGRFPSWLHTKIPKGENIFQTNQILEKYNLNTVCEEAKCPNRLECFSKKTATFMACGKTCTRACSFCEIDFSKTPKLPDPQEPEKIARSALELGLNHVVITMVARDDLEDQGSHHIANCILTLKTIAPHVTIEVLTSDFSGKTELLDIVLNQKPHIFNHNIETVARLSPKIRHKAEYLKTLSVLKHAKDSQKAVFIKSGLMVGLGETIDEVKQTLVDLHAAGCDIVTIGQYLQASQKKIIVKEFVSPDTFRLWEDFGLEIGLKHVYSGPFVRSSYNAENVFKTVKNS